MLGFVDLIVLFVCVCDLWICGDSSRSSGAIGNLMIDVGDSLIRSSTGDFGVLFVLCRRIGSLL